MELILNTNLETAIPAVIDWNHEQLKSDLAPRLEKYNSLVVTEDAITDAKKDRANLNKLRTAIDDRRKEVKKACLKPYDEFERKAKEIVSLIDQPIVAIDKQIKVFDDAEKQEKYDAIEAFFTEKVGDLSELILLEKVIPAKWSNKGEPLESIKKDISDKLTKIRNDIGIIRAMRLDCETAMISEYLKSYDMSSALAEKTRYEELQKKLAERQAAERQKEKEAATNVHYEEVPVKQAASYHSAPQVAPTDEDIKDIDVRFYDTTVAFRADMRALTEKHNIKYGGLK